MKRILFVGRNYKNKIVNGGNEVTKRNVEILKGIYNVDEILLEFKVNNIRKLIDVITMNSLNFNKNIKKKIIKKLKNNNYEYVWIDGSTYGSISKYIKKNIKNIKIITFFHNVEFFYYKEKIKVEGVKNTLMLPYAFFNEKKSIKYSDKIIVLNKRDNDKLNRKYKKHSDLILPLTLEDKYIDIKDNEKNEKVRALFVGSNFFANVHGVEWFIENILPEVDIDLYIVGSGMEQLKVKLESKSKKIKVLGYVKDIGEEYRKADFVITPIFYGSGMKTKTTEALMYGKTIYGTPEAFEGFNLKFPEVGFICKNTQEFIEKIKKHNGEKFNMYSRKEYLEKYDNKIIIKKIKEELEC